MGRPDGRGSVASGRVGCRARTVRRQRRGPPRPRSPHAQEEAGRWPARPVGVWLPAGDGSPRAGRRLHPAPLLRLAEMSQERPPRTAVPAATERHQPLAAVNPVPGMKLVERHHRRQLPVHRRRRTPTPPPPRARVSRRSGPRNHPTNRPKSSSRAEVQPTLATERNSNRSRRSTAYERTD